MSLGPWNTRENMHAHTCEGCGFVWEHRDQAQRLSKEELRVLHTCRRCGAQQFTKEYPETAKRLLQKQEERETRQCYE